MPAAATAPQDDPGEIHLAALESLFRDHHHGVFRAAYRITGDAMDAEDVLQSVFLRLLRREDASVEAPTAGAYLHRAAVNAALDLLRRRRRSASQDLAGLAEAVADEASPGPEDRQQGRELREALREALGRLAPESAEAFALRYFEGFGNREIAAVLGVTPSAVAVRLHRARLRLQQELTAHRGELS